MRRDQVTRPPLEQPMIAALDAVFAGHLPYGASMAMSEMIARAREVADLAAEAEIVLRSHIRVYARHYGFNVAEEA